MTHTLVAILTARLDCRVDVTTPSGAVRTFDTLPLAEAYCFDTLKADCVSGSKGIIRATRAVAEPVTAQAATKPDSAPVMVGTMQTGKVVHRAKYATTKQGVKLYEPACSRMVAYRSLCYLSILPEGTPVTCKKCGA